MPPDRKLPLRHAVALGLVQGPAELLPVSSSAHTTLLPWLAGWRYGELDGELRKSFEVALHAGAGAALAIDMRAELLDALRGLDGRGAATLALSALPPALAGYTLRAAIERRLGGPRSIAAGLAGGAGAMAVAEVRAGRRAQRTCADTSPRDGLALGFAQAFALIPGVSRNGATLTAARARGFTRASAHAFSWNVALPVIVGAGLLKGVRARRGDDADSAGGGGERAALAAGAASAFASTLVSARLLARRERGLSLLWFALYRCLLAALVLRRARRTG